MHIRTKTSFILLITSSILNYSCKDDSFITPFDKNSTEVKMIATSFINDDTSRSILTPNENGTSFSWEANDIVAVYSDQKGLTNFFIDETSISDDKTSANFYGSGFSLSPTSTYYAFYPYEMNQSLNKSQIPIKYNNQQQKFNKDFASLGNFDYMSATGSTDTSGHVSFTFKHLGCVVKYSITVPKTANYNKLQLELDTKNDSSAYLINNGYIDLTVLPHHIEAYEKEKQDSILSVILNGSEGIQTKEDSILTVYMMMAPQDLSRNKLKIRLIDTSNNWYTANIVGKNMKAGYTYSYSLNKTGENGFTGSGSGLPNDDNLNLTYVSSLKPNKNYYFEDFIEENNILYSVGSQGIIKADISNQQAPTIIAEKQLITDYNKKIRSIALSGDYIYASLRQNTGGTTEALKPAIRMNFESNIKEYTLFNSSSQLSNNNTFNSFFKELRIISTDPSQFTRVYLFKAASNNGYYRNSILFSDLKGKSISFVGKDYSTREEALAELGNSYQKSNGDFCLVNWNSIKEGKTVLDLKIYSQNQSSGLTNDNTCNQFFKKLHINSIDPASINRIYIFKANLTNGVYKNSILLSDGKGQSLSFVGKTYSTQNEALNALDSIYTTSNDDYCKVNWNALTSSQYVATEIKLISLGSFDSYNKTDNASISETGNPCPNTGLYSAKLQTNSKVSSNEYAILSRVLDKNTNTVNLSLWMNIPQEVKSKIYIPVLETSTTQQISLTINPLSSKTFEIGLSAYGIEKIGNVIYNNNEWYNIKLVLTSSEIQTMWRSKEAGEWNNNLLFSIENSSKISSLLLGIKTSSPNTTVLIDDYYYNPTNIDKVANINGNLLVINKNDLSIITTYNLDLKATDLYIRGNYLFLNCLKGFNVYNIEDKTNPKLIYTHRDSKYKEYQGADFYTYNGHEYMVSSNYNSGISIWDITEPTNIKLVSTKDFTGFTSSDGQSLEGKGYNFDIIANFPYIYSTWAVNTPYINTDYFHIGLLVYDVSNVNNISVKLIEIPKEDRYNIMTDGDKKPTRIARLGNHLILNNANKGIVTYNISTPESPIYENQIDVKDNTSINPVYTTKNNLVIVGDKKIHLLEAIK